MKHTSSIGIAFTLCLASCGNGDASSSPGPVGGAATTAGGASASGGATAVTGGAERTGGSGTMGSTGGSDVPWYLLGGTGGVSNDRSDEPHLAAAIASQDTACNEACENALVCQPIHETIENCRAAFICDHVDLLVDDSEATDDVLIACLEAGTLHMKCVAGIECARYAEWWNESAQPFPCQPEQTEEEQACAGTGLFGWW